MRERICSLSLQGNNPSYISHILNLKRQTVASIIKRFELTGQSQPARKGGDTRSKLLDTQKASIRHWVDNDCLLTLKQLVDKVREEFGITVSKSCVDKVLNDFHYTLKKADLIPEARNYRSTIESRFTYSQNYRRLELEYPIESFIFIDEVGFSVSTRPKKGRALKGERATTPVPYSRSRNISVVAAMNKNGMIYHKIHNAAVNRPDFQVCLNEMKIKLIEIGIENPLVILDNARIHHSRVLDWTGFDVLYLPPYCPFLNPIENCFSKWKNAVIRSRCTTESHLKETIKNKFSVITMEDCNGYYRNMLKYLQMAANGEEINN